MFIRRVLSGALFPCLNNPVRDGLHCSATSFSYVRTEHPHPYSVDDFPHLTSFKSKVTSQSKPLVPGDSSISISSDLQTLFCIEHRFELYQFLRRLAINKFLYEEIILLVHDHQVTFDFPKVLKLMDLYTWNSTVDGVAMMKNYAEASHRDEFIAHGKFLAHQTLCENMNQPVKALSKLMDMAPKNAGPEATIVGHIELLLNKVILCGSRCNLDKVNSFLISYYCPKLKGQLLCSSWVSLYLSPYENDLEMAARILETNEHIMMPHLDITLSRIAEYLLKGQQLNRYYVLLQLFSKWSHRKKTEKLLEMLFHHFYKTNHVRGCFSCVSLASDLKLTLADEVMYKFETLKKCKPVSARTLDMTFLF